MIHKPFQRNTPQRRAILEELQKAPSHPTAVELYEIVRRRMPKISLGTVYRNLELLAQTGTIRKLTFSGAEARFDANPDCHCHVRCVRCGRVDDLAGLPPELVNLQPDQAGGYQILGHRVEFIGVCPHCRTKSEQPDINPQHDAAG